MGRPYSFRSNTDRQYAYARNFAQDSVYTPEMVVDGRHGFIGSDIAQAKRENEGTTLVHSDVVRSLTKIGTIEIKATREFRATLPFSIAAQE